MSPSDSPHLYEAHKLWENANSFHVNQKIVVTGTDLDISTVVGVSRGKTQPSLTDDLKTVARIHSSVKLLEEYLAQGNAVYGVTTGFGGSADSRTAEKNKLQIALLQLTQSGVLLDSDKTTRPTHSEYHTEQNSIPASWVRATMLVRCNATVRGHSAVTMGVLEAILRLLRHNITPIIPLRGTVSASGDLMPLAYIAGALEGNPDVVVRKDQGADATVMTARDALAQENLPKMTFGPKEALGLVNGTAPSAGLAALVMYDAHQIAVLSQAFTAMAVEGLEGNSESFHPFIARVRPHSGQIEASRNILAFLQGSSLAKGIKSQKDRNPTGLAQDRYALRSAPQWIGPQLEDLQWANHQVSTELNSSADNPLVDVEAREVYYGANFQAAVITSAMEKTRLALQMLGRLFFAQATELIDPNLNNGLPTNLVADDPSTSFTMKGVDINMAAYMSELCFLASPVSTHVQAAEMHNQSVNSLAFLSGRMTKKATELVALMCASCLYIGCQALDLRALQREYLSELKPAVEKINRELLSSKLAPKEIVKLDQNLSGRIAEAWKAASRLDIAERFDKVCDTAVLSLSEVLQASHRSGPESVSVDFLNSWRQELRSTAKSTCERVSKQFMTVQNTEEYLGAGSKALYRKIRRDIGVPFHQGLVEHPGADLGEVLGDQKRPRKTVGSWISDVYEALLQGQMNDALYKAMDPAEASTQIGLQVNGFATPPASESY